MKVLSIKEPFATLIMDKDKMIETRSFKTNYRGELYIHTSLGSVNIKEKVDFFNLVGKRCMHNGYIICKCRLVDCVYMSSSFVEDMKKNNYKEYICGEYKEGRYAWVLSDIQALDEFIPAKGKLGIWNYNK